MLGSGMLMFGLGLIAAGWVIGLPDGSNISATISNVSIFISGGFNLIGALLTFTYRKNPLTATLRGKIYGMVSFVVVSFAILVVAAIMEINPTVFYCWCRARPPSGSLIISVYCQWHFLRSHRSAFSAFSIRKKDDFFYLYSMSLALIAIRFFRGVCYIVMGNPVNWVGRATIYLAAFLPSSRILYH